MNKKSTLDIVERALRGQVIDDLVAGWSFTIEEVSSNVYKVEGRDMRGHHVSRHGIDPESLLAQSVKDAQRIGYRTKFLMDAKAYLAKMLRLKK